MSKILRGGRLNSVREDISKFTSSIKDDLVLSQAVIDINKAHVIMLMEENIVECNLDDNTLKLQFNAFEIKTLKVNNK